MTRRVPQRILLSFVCALALILIPLSYSPVWAQSATPGTQQDRTDQNNVDQNQSNQDLNKTQTQSKSPDMNRQKPDTSATNPNTQNENQNQSDYNTNQPNTGSQKYNGTTGSQTPNQKRSNMNRSTTSHSTTTTTEESNQNPDQNASDRNLPKTAGELPLIALIGLLAFGAAAGTRLLARARSSR